MTLTLMEWCAGAVGSSQGAHFEAITGEDLEVAA